VDSWKVGVWGRGLALQPHPVHQSTRLAGPSGLQPEDAERLGGVSAYQRR